MQFSVEYKGGVFYFSVSAPETDPNYLEEFEIEDPEEAKDMVEDLIEEIQEAEEVDDDVDDLFGGMEQQ